MARFSVQTEKNVKSLSWFFIFLVPLILITRICMASTTILTSASPNHTVTSGSDEQIYGTSSSNRITIESGATAELINFPGQNVLEILTTADGFTVSRSGTIVTFQGIDGTLLTIPATQTAQIIDFTDRSSLTLSIYNGQVMLDDQVITTNPVSIIFIPNPYDTFDSSPMDKNKWRWHDLVRAVSDGKLHMNIQSCGAENLLYAHPTIEKFSFVKANVLVDSDSYVSENNNGRIRLQNICYNDSRGASSGQDYDGYEGEVIAEVSIFLEENGVLKAKARVKRFDDVDPYGATTELYLKDFPQNISFDTEYELSVEFTGTSIVFKCNSETLTYIIEGPIYPSSIDNGSINAYVNGSSGECIYLKTQIDNISFDKNGTIYDTFEGTNLDSTKWNDGEFIRQIEDGKLRLKVERCNETGNNTVSPTVTNESGYIEAKVTVNEGGVSQGKTGFARLASYFYNEKRGPESGLDYNGYQDNVWSSVRILLDDTGTLKAVAEVWRSDDPGESYGTSLLYEDFILPIEFGQEYTLAMMYTGSEIYFQCNDEIIKFEIQSPVYESYDKHYYLQTRVYNDEQYCGFIDSTYDDVLIKPMDSSDSDGNGIIDTFDKFDFN